MTVSEINKDPNFKNARPLDVHTWSEFNEVNIFIDKIHSELIQLQGNERINKKLLKVLLLDLYVAWSTDPTMMVMFSRDNNAYRSKSRYNEIHIGKKIVDIVDALVSQNVIQQQKGFNDRRNGIGFQSRLWPSEGLKQRFEKAKFSRFHISDHAQRETVVLRDKDKNAIDDYVENETTISTRSLLSDYNTLLANTHFEIYDLDTPVLNIGQGTKGMRLPINQTDKFVRRIFNNGRWDKGGRFYGGWWQRCPKEYRKRIVFDDIATAELDFSGLHIVLLYAKENINYWTEVNGDPYLIPSIDGIDDTIDLRAAAKLLLLTALNADTPTEAFGAFRQQSANGSAEKRLKDKQLSTILDVLKHKHEPISHKLASGAGIDLMYLDSEITKIIIERFTRHYKCPILTIHDSYIVPFGYDRILYDEMQNAFEKVSTVSFPAIEHTTQYYDILENGPLTDKPTDMSRFMPSARHLKDWQEFKVFKSKPDDPEWLPHWTMIW